MPDFLGSAGGAALVLPVRLPGLLTSDLLLLLLEGLFMSVLLEGLFMSVLLEGLLMSVLLLDLTAVSRRD